ncbi:copia protein [Tanacetum coccineum]
MKIIGTKLVFRNKLDENDIVSRNKARLVTQGYNQQEGIDYDETYALVARLESIRILLAFACALDFNLFQMDVKSAFLNGFINEEEVDINKKTENQAKMTKLSMEWKRLCRIKAKVQKKSKSKSKLKNTIGCNLNPSDGPGKPNSITMKTVKTKWALNQFQQPICVQLTKTVKTLKAQS